MFNKYQIPNYIIGIVSFALELTCIALGTSRDMFYFIGAIVIYILSAAYGGWIQWIGAKYHNATSYIITAGFGLQVPFAQVLTIYFTYRFIKESK